MMTDSIPTAHNAAAWALTKKSRPLVVADAAYVSPVDEFVSIKVHSIAINPIDWIVQSSDVFAMAYPAILGLDVAGEIYEIGSKVPHRGWLSKGQRVIAIGDVYSSKLPSRGTFQRYCHVHYSAIAPLPTSIPYTSGVVLPLGITTAAAGLYQKGSLSLPLPALPHAPLHASTDRFLLVWGGSSSVGSNAIQLAVASGATVIITASPSNFAYCCSLGAQKCFDYHSPSVEDDIVKYISGSTIAGAFHAAGSEDAVKSCARIVDRLQGKTLVVTVRGAISGPDIPPTVRIVPISAFSIFQHGSAVGSWLWGHYLPAALSKGAISLKPDPLIAGEGLRSIQHAMDVQKRGVSAAKVVVTRIQDS